MTSSCCRFSDIVIRAGRCGKVRRGAGGGTQVRHFPPTQHTLPHQLLQDYPRPLLLGIAVYWRCSGVDCSSTNPAPLSALCHNPTTVHSTLQHIQSGI